MTQRKEQAIYNVAHKEIVPAKVGHVIIKIGTMLYYRNIETGKRQEIGDINALCRKQ